jgi:D-alanyl-D-alanine carboxypeptidase/D-alanyl-D-alanine-endopeptidase (penicillin-binding protein 4)
VELRVKRALIMLLCAVSTSAATIPEAVDAAMATPPFQRALWFIVVEDANGVVLYERNGNALAIPASVRKLFAAVTAAECLRLDSQLPTELWSDGEDLILRGGADPSFGAERYAFTPETTFEPFLRALRARNVRRVRDVIADVSAFDRVTIPYQWKVGNLTSDYAAPVDAIAYAENEIKGVSAPNAGLFAAQAFRDQLLAAGIAVHGTVRVEVQPREWRERITAVMSPFIYDLMTVMLKNSHNLYAEMLYKLAGGGTYDGARHVESQLLTTEVRIAADEFRFVDGSGLAPDDLVTAAAMVRLLRWMDQPDRGVRWWDLLARPGEPEGTLRNRLKPLTDRLRGKTGSVAGVNSLAGIIRGQNGGTRYFAIIINHHTGSGATRLIDTIVEAIAEF